MPADGFKMGGTSRVARKQLLEFRQGAETADRRGRTPGELDFMLSRRDIVIFDLGEILFI